MRSFPTRRLASSSCSVCRLTLHTALIISSDPPHADHIFDEHLVAGDGIREAVSTAGYLLGDCTWASPRETMQHQRVIRTWKTEEGADVTVSTMDNKRAETTKCAKRWGRERDDEVQAGPLLAVLLHFVKGLATVSWLYMAGTRVRASSSLMCPSCARADARPDGCSPSVRQWILFAMTVRFVWPRVGNRLPFNIFRDLRTIGASLVRRMRSLLLAILSLPD